MKTPILVDINFDPSRGDKGFANGMNGRPIYNLAMSQEPDDYSSIKYALVWRPQEALLRKLTGLELLISAGAGVDHIFETGVELNVPLLRFTDPNLTNRMCEWVCLQCLNHLRQTYQYNKFQKNKIWQELPQPDASQINVGIMGLGTLGKDAALKLKALGFRVSGWSRTKKHIDGIDCFGESELDVFLSNTNFLVGLLPHTKLTQEIFNRELFSKLKKHADIASPVFINGGRGASQIEADIISSMNDRILGGVSLDVFENEPLPANSPLWDLENTFLTPHSAANSSVAALGKFAERQIERFESGLPLENLVDPKMGY